MAKGPKFQFKIPEPRFGGTTPTKVKDYNPAPRQPTDANQLAPTVGYPMPQRYRQGGGC